MELSKINTRILYTIYASKTKEPVSYETFKFITQEFHKQLAPKVIDSYRFNPIAKLGTFLVVMNYRKKRSEKYIDWKKSNQRRAEIITQGGTPYEEWWAINGEPVELERGQKPPNGAVKCNNDGEKWFIYFNDAYYFNWSWYKDKVAKFTRHITKYNFVPTRGNKRAISTIIDKNDSPELTYVIYNKKGQRKNNPS